MNQVVPLDKINNGEDKMKQLPKYCNKCGKELVSDRKIHSFDIFTGQPVDETVTLRCPDFIRFLGKRGSRHFYSKQRVTLTV